MSGSLKKEIINHIFNRFGLLSRKNINSSLNLKDGPISPMFLLDQKLMFEIDEKKYENNIWSGETTIDGAKVQFIVADITEDISEFALLLQLDSFPPYAARISSDNEDAGSLFFKIDNNWIEASYLFQAKILVAVESLIEMFVSWEKNKSPDNIYKNLIDFLKFESSNDE